MSDVSIKLNPLGRREDIAVIVDGHDIADAVTGLRLSAAPGRIPQLELSLSVLDVTEFGSPHIQVHLDSMTAAYLERAGWTPPPGVASVLALDESGCPCEWVDVTEYREGFIEIGTDPEIPATVLGRTVPTCPVHGSA